MLDGWGGRFDQDVLVIGETPKRFRIMAPPGRSVKLGGRRRWLSPGEIALVPKHAVRVSDTEGTDE